MFSVTNFDVNLLANGFSSVQTHNQHLRVIFDSELLQAKLHFLQLIFWEGDFSWSVCQSQTKLHKETL